MYRLWRWQSENMTKPKVLSIETEGRDVGSGKRLPITFLFEPYGDHILVTVDIQAFPRVRIEQAAISRDNLKAASLLRD